MRTRSACRCLLCQLELRLKQQLREARHLESYSEVAQSSLGLSGFPNAFALTEHLRTCRSNGNGSHPADAVLLELLHLRWALRTDTVLRDILLLAFIPVLHSTSRQIAKQYASVPSDDAAQHLVVTFLEALDSSVLRGRNSHLAFAISRMVRRKVFDWARRESRTPGSADRDDPLAEPASILGIPEPLERAAFLRHFLFRCERQGLLTALDLELLVHIKLEGSLGEPGKTPVVYSNSLRQKVKRLLGKLREAARLPSTAVQQQDPPKPT
jgi:DNA-directed RNA polymerase specialized sigma24 family protein